MSKNDVGLGDVQRARVLVGAGGGLESEVQAVAQALADERAASAGAFVALGRELAAVAMQRDAWRSEVDARDEEIARLRAEYRRAIGVVHDFHAIAGRAGALLDAFAGLPPVVVSGESTPIDQETIDEACSSQEVCGAPAMLGNPGVLLVCELAADHAGDHLGGGRRWAASVPAA